MGDVAALIAASLFHPDLNRTDIEPTAGATPIDEAVAGLAPDRGVPRQRPSEGSRHLRQRAIQRPATG